LKIYYLFIIPLMLLGCQRSSKDYYNDGIDYFSKNNTKDAIDAFNKSLEISPNDTSCIMYLGKCFFKQENYPKAIYYFNKIYSSYPQKEDCIYSLALNYFYLGNGLKALQHADTLLKYNPNKPEYNVIKGRICIQLNKFEDSKKYLLKAIDLNPSDAYGFYSLALSYNYLNNPDSSIFYAKKYYEQKKDYLSRFLLASIYLLRANNREEANNEYTKLIDSIESDSHDNNDNDE